MLDAIRRTGAGESCSFRTSATACPSPRLRPPRRGRRHPGLFHPRTGQGIAATAVHEPARAFDADVVAMTTAAGHTRHGAVTVAAREAVTMAGVCRPGDILGVVEGDFVDRDRPARRGGRRGRADAVGGRRAGHAGHRRGRRGAALAEVVAALRRSHPEVDTVVYDGGQPRLPAVDGGRVMPADWDEPLDQGAGRPPRLSPPASTSARWVT